MENSSKKELDNSKCDANIDKRYNEMVDMAEHYKELWFECLVTIRERDDEIKILKNKLNTSRIWSKIKHILKGNKDAN